MKIITLNIWRYYNWEDRKEKLIDFLKKENADIIFVQEAAYDERLKYKNQVDEINQKLKYKFHSFQKLMEMTKWHDKNIDWEMFYGFGFLSKYKIKNEELVILPKIEKSKNFGFFHISVETQKGDVDFINVHFENTNVGSKEHLKQTLEWCKEKNIKPIIAGDFNMKIIKDIKDTADKDYYISYFIKEYKSFIPTDFSHDKIPITLDYIIANKEKFNITRVECIDTDISDHRPVIAEIILKH